MDDMSSRRRRKPKEHGRRRMQWYAQQTKTYRKNVWKLLNEHKHTVLSSILLLILVVLLFGISGELQPPTVSNAPANAQVISYSSFIEQVKAGGIAAVVIQGSDINGLQTNASAQSGVISQATAQGTPVANTPKDAAQAYAAWVHNVSQNGSAWTNSPSTGANHSVYTRAPQGGDPQLMALLLSNHVIVNTLPATQSSAWMNVLWRFLPIVFLLLFFFMFLHSRNSRSSRPMDERITQIGKSRARRFVRAKEANSTKDSSNLSSQSAKTPITTPTQTTKTVTPSVSIEPPVTFDDVAGIEEVRTELEEIVRFLRNPGQFNRLGAHIPRGALLVGPPGTGKTLLAKAVAGEASVPFFSMSASEFVEMFVGVGASRVRDLFNQARQVAPCVIFIDEIDAVGRKRTMRVSGNDERDQTLNQLLVELDGFNERQTVVVLAATNRVDILDKALLRPGRFDRRITVSLPDRVGRQAILKVHTRNTPLHEDVSLERLSRMTTGMSGADLANLVNEAALCAARRDLERIPHDCFEDALARVQLGALRPIVMSERERRIIAFHEGGHALVAHHLPEADTVNRVTILPRGQSLGVTQFTAEEDCYNYSRHMLMARIAVGLGGRVAEELTFGSDQITTGAENDLQVVTNLARRMVTRWGMSERVGVVFTDYQAGDGEMSLNMRRVDPDSIPAHSLSLALNVDGQLVRNGMPELRQAFALSASAPRTMSGATMNALIDSEVQSILNEGRDMARTLLREHSDQLTQLADALMEHEQLDRAQFEALLA